MENRLTEVLQGKVGNYLLPFFWQHGETKELLEEGMEKIRDSGIKAVCVESRPHPDFLGDKWWEDLTVIMNKAKELDMKVWVLDDAHFPSGYCSGQIKDDSPYRKIYLDHYCVDCAGPRKGLAFMVRLNPGERYVGAVLGRRDRCNTKKLYDLRNVSGLMKEGKIYLDVPDGLWCLVVLKITDKGTGRKNYINSIDHDSVRFFLDTVYEAHYAHYAEDFGKTFAGFFSDEPEIGNCLGEYRFQAVVGQKEMRLPWSAAVECRLKSLWQDDYEINLVNLWMETDERTEESNRTGLIRAQFMDLISEQYGKNFCGQIGDWCREHSVEYIGHVIEDGGTHAHVGLGTGHFFRALWGQDMSGIDVVLQQILPMLDDCEFYSIGGTSFYDGELFHYGLAKMGVSLGQLDPKKKGRTMCEVFGAYGWAEGLKLMKWLLDHMLVNGVNYFVPHAFTMRDFPDPDCPPHFYARGNNPQYPYFKNVMEYTNRVSHLIQDGVHAAKIGILYTAEQEWMGSFRPFEKDARVLTRNQIDFEILPTEYLLQAEIQNGEIPYGQKTLQALIIPGSSFISKELADRIELLRENGIPVWFSERLPQVLGPDGGLEKRDYKELLCETEEQLIRQIRACSELTDIQVSDYEPFLRYYHYLRPEGSYYLFFTEDILQDLHTQLKIFLSDRKKACWYDPWTNEITGLAIFKDGKTDLSLSAYEMKILFIENDSENGCTACAGFEKNETGSGCKERTIQIPDSAWTLKVKNGLCPEKQEGEPFAVEETAVDFSPVLGDLSQSSRLPYFTGTMTYTTEVDGRETAGAKRVILSLGEVYETAAVSLNGRELGVRVAPPYQFDLTGKLENGRNELSVKVINTLVHSQRDFLSMTMPMEPSGLIGPVVLKIH